MPPRVHLLLYRHANKAVLSAGLVAAAWYWPALGEKGIFLLFLPALFAYLLLPAALALGFRARCPVCDGPARLEDVPREERKRERVYRCERCQHVLKTGVRFEREPI